jgi:hypothetical protein
MSRTSVITDTLAWDNIGRWKRRSIKYRDLSSVGRHGPPISDVRVCEDGTMDFQLPAGLTHLLSTGVWPSADGPSMSAQELHPSIPADRVRRFAADESLICLQPPPFRTIAQVRTRGCAGDFWERFGALDQIVPEAALVIGDFGSGQASTGRSRKVQSLLQEADVPGVRIMRWPLVWYSIRRILIWMVCGAGAGVLLHYAALGGPQGPVEEANWFERVVEFACIVAVLGGIAGGVLSASAWAMFAGGLIGAIVMGVVGVALTHHLKGLMYSILGVPVGALFVFLYWASREVAKPADKTCVPPASAGVWDKELDR